jgi:hypothetical protein
MDFKEVQDGLFEIAREIRSEQEVAPIAFLLVVGGIVQVPLFQIPKDQWRDAIVQGIRQTRARAVIVHTEAYVVEGPQAATAVAAKMAGLPSLQDFPGRREILQSNMELPDGTYRTLTATIEDGKLGPTEATDIPKDAKIEGQFTRFFDC